MSYAARGPNAYEAKWRERLAKPAYFDGIAEGLSAHGIERLHVFSATSDEYPDALVDRHGLLWHGATTMVYETVGKAMLAMVECSQDVYADRHQGWVHRSSWLMDCQAQLDLGRLGRREYRSLYRDEPVEGYDPRIDHECWWREQETGRGRFQLLGFQHDGEVQYRLDNWQKRGLSSLNVAVEQIRTTMTLLEAYLAEKFGFIKGASWAPELVLPVYDPKRSSPAYRLNDAVGEAFWAGFPVERLTAKSERPFTRS